MNNADFMPVVPQQLLKDRRESKVSGFYTWLRSDDSMLLTTSKCGLTNVITVRSTYSAILFTPGINICSSLSRPLYRSHINSKWK